MEILKRNKHPLSPWVTIVEKEIITNVALISIGSLMIGIVLLLSAILLYTLVSVVRERNTR